MGLIRPTLKDLLEWAWAINVKPLSPSEPPPAPQIEAPGPTLSQLLNVETGSPHPGEATFATDYGTSTVRNRIRTACGCSIPDPFAHCCWCERPISTEKFREFCVIPGCGLPLCNRCVHKLHFSGVPFILCPKHAWNGEQTGDPYTKWS